MMTAGVNLDWLWYTLAAVLGAAGLVLLVWSLFWDRSRGRRRCPRCWYSMVGVPGLTCPECGRAVRREKRLFRTRRRWRWVPLAAVLALAGYVCWLLPVALRDGWVRVIPSSALVLIAPMNDNAWQLGPSIRNYPPMITPTSQLLTELIDRWKKGSLARWQTQVLWDRFLRARPAQVGWLLRARDRWPRGEPVVVEVGPFFFPLPMNATMALRVHIRGSSWAWAERSLSTNFPEAVASANLGPPPPSVQELEIEAELLDGVRVTTDGYQISSRDTSRSHRLWHGTLRRIHVVEEPADAMLPLMSGATETQSDIESDLNPQLGRDSDGQLKLVTRQLGWHIGSGAVDWALGARVEVLHDGRIAAKGECLYPMIEPGTIADFMWPGHYTFPLVWSEPPPTDARLEGQWKIRLIGDPAVAIRDLGRTVYWDGRIEIPIFEIRTIRQFGY